MIGDSWIEGSRQCIYSAIRQLCGNRRLYPDVYLASTFSSINNSVLLLFSFVPISFRFSIPPFPRYLLPSFLSASHSLIHPFWFPSASLFVFLSILLFDESSRLTRALLLSNGCPLFTRLRNSLCLYNGCLTRWVVFAIDRSSPAQTRHRISIVFQRITRLPHAFDRDSPEFLLSHPFRSFGLFVPSLTRPY